MINDKTLHIDNSEKLIRTELKEWKTARHQMKDNHRKLIDFHECVDQNHC